MTREPRLAADPTAQLCAYLTATPLSARTLRLLAALALEEERLAAIGYGSVTVDLTPDGLRLVLHHIRPRVAVDLRVTH